MKIIIPMTGYGSRFAAAGYKELKPFIEVQGRPILQWIVEGMYHGEKDILFVCRQEHLDTIPGCDGAIPCYTGFHPHLMIEKNYYASCLTDEKDNLEQSILPAYITLKTEPHKKNTAGHWSTRGKH